MDRFGYYDYEYYRVYPHPLKRTYCKVLYIIDKVTADTSLSAIQTLSEILKDLKMLIGHNGIGFVYKAHYVKEHLYTCWSGGCETTRTNDVIIKEPLLYYVIEQEYFEVAKELIQSHCAKVTASIKKLVKNRIAYRKQNAQEKQRYSRHGYFEPNDSIDDDYHALEIFARNELQLTL